MLINNFFGWNFLVLLCSNRFSLIIIIINFYEILIILLRINYSKIVIFLFLGKNFFQTNFMIFKNYFKFIVNRTCLLVRIEEFFQNPYQTYHCICQIVLHDFDPQYHQNFRYILPFNCLDCDLIEVFHRCKIDFFINN
jgi:hypothetical protein